MSVSKITNSISNLKIPTYSQSNTTKTYANTYKNGDKTYNKQIDSLLNSAKNMGNFSPEKSAYYQTSYNGLKDYLTKQGKNNMKSVMSDVAATNTGGYGNSYATTAGTSAFQQSLDKLTAQIPSLYANASSDWSDKKNALYTQAGAIGTERDYAQNKNLNLWNSSITNDQNAYNNNYNSYNARLARLQALLSAE